VRRLRTQLRSGALSQAQYEAAIDRQIALAIGVQEGLGLDVLVHGEPERTDMSEHFGVGWG
jgi:5-methyltetrahydropteroyltriglutamate--homocysteine methyltransferase